jgi:hypothetical protein
MAIIPRETVRAIVSVEIILILRMLALLGFPAAVRWALFWQDVCLMK